MTLPLRFPLSFVAFFAIFFGVRPITARLPATVATYAISGIVLALFYIGPRLFASDWYYMGFALGFSIGDCGRVAYVRMTETEKKDMRWRGNQIGLIVLMLLVLALIVMFARH